jgi:threonine synthase
VPTLATGEPYNYPLVAKIVKKSKGSFVRMREDKLADYGKLVAFEQKVLLGPASAVCVAGFFESLKKGLIKNGETVLLNTGEGVRRAPDFVNEMIYTTKQVDCADECQPHNISDFREQLWKAVE